MLPLPVTTNFMNISRLRLLAAGGGADFISWDSYPMWHRDKDETALACYTAMYHDMMRSLKGGKTVCADGVHPGRHQLAADQQTEEAGNAYSFLATGGGAWRRLGAVFPVAEKPRFG